MSTYDSTGLTVDRYQTILDRMIALAEAWKGESLSTDEQELLGHIFRQEALLTAEANEIIQAVYDAISVANATGAQLDNLLELINLFRQGAAASTVTLTCTVTKATTIPAGSLVRTAANVYFETDSDLVFVGAGSNTVTATCTVNGPNNAAIGEVNTIATPVNGWTTVTNLAAVIPGRDREIDAELKARHAAAVATSGERDAASIDEAVGAVTGVSGVKVVEDYTSATPVYVYVIGGSDLDVATAIDSQRTIGIGTGGTTAVDVYSTVTKETETIRFTRASDVDVYVSMSLTVNSALFPADGDDQIKANIETLFEAQEIGDDVIYLTLPGAILQVPGCVINTLYLGLTASPSGTSDLVIANDERAVIDAADIVVSHI